MHSHCSGRNTPSPGIDHFTSFTPEDLHPNRLADSLSNPAQPRPNRRRRSSSGGRPQAESRRA
jgi:hypothetical protein